MVSFRDGVALAAVGWWLSPVLTFLLNKFLSYLYDASKKLLEMRSGTTRLRFTLDQVLEQRMLIELSEKKPDFNTKVKDLDALLRDLNNALYEAEEIFDLIDYHRIEKEVGNDAKTSWLQWRWQRIYDSARERSAPLLQWVKQGLCWLWHWVRIAAEKSAPFLQLAWQGLCWLGRCLPRSEELLPVDSTASASSVHRISLWVRSFDFNNFYSCILNWLSKAIEGARYYRDWSFDQFGFKSYRQGTGMESNCTVMGPLYIILNKNMEKVEHLIVEAQEIISLGENLQETIVQPNQSRRSEKGTYVSNVTAGERQGLGLHLHSNANQSHAVSANSRAAVTTATPPSVVIGLDKDCDKIVAMLHERKEDGQPETSSAQCYSVIGIHGVAGSGKSTLVQLVCAREKEDRQEKKDGHFDLVMLVYVSREFSVDTIFKEMFEAATGTSCPHFNNLDTLQSNLEKELHGKWFLLVLDDVWYSNRVGGDTTQILSPLNSGKAGSKVLVTSRNKDALLALGVENHRCIPISFLDDDVFLNLFMHYALHSLPVDDLRRKLEDIGKEIAKKLKGLPLAAKIVGGQLCIRQNLEFWRKVRDQNLWNETMGALWGSYQLLDEEVRRCFAYCSIFPRRRGLERDELVKLWAAQGFNGRGNEGEDICRNYFDELVSASFLQLRAKGRPDKKNDCYVVHDLLYDLAEKVTGGDCFRIENLQSPEMEVPPDVLHVFVQTYDAALITEKVCKLDNLRTLIIDEVECVEEKVLKSMFERLRKLRVLIMSKGSNEMFMSERIDNFPPATSQFSVPASIGQLRHLRYLAFRVAGGGEERTRLVLPGTLTKLYHMQVLDFDRIQGVVLSSWEGSFGLINLRHLIGPENLKIPNIGRLTSLQSMRYFAATKEQGYELKQLGNLNKLSGGLCITCLENVESEQEALEAKLAHMEGLRELSLCWYGEASPEVQVEVLEVLCPPNDLESLTINGYKGLRYPSWMVGRGDGGPKNLKHLKFGGWIAEPGPELRGFITHLCMLTIRDCSWQALPDCMEHLASLQKLMIYGCRNILSLPTLPQCLELFVLAQCNEVLMSSCRTIEDPNWRKIQHIPRASIGGCKITMGVVHDRNKDRMPASMVR